MYKLKYNNRKTSPNTFFHVTKFYELDRFYEPNYCWSKNLTERK
jgi:hypothetical protein